MTLQTLEQPRATTECVWGKDDAQVLKVVEGKTVLEFGPGSSTQTFIDAGATRVVSCEYIDKWLEVAKERFRDEPRIEILKFHDTVPVAVEDFDPEWHFDVGFVDAPKGFIPLRRQHPQFPDCSRLNTCMFALEYCDIVFLHDAMRGCERATLAQLERWGFKCELILTRIGLAKITRDESRSNIIDTPSLAEFGRFTPRAVTLRAGIPVGERPSGHDDRGAEAP